MCFVLCCLFFTLHHQITNAQTYEFANAISSEQEVDLSANAVDGNLLTAAGVRASSGLILGAGAYSGHLELEFPTLLGSKYHLLFRLDTEDDLITIFVGR